MLIAVTLSAAGCSFMPKAGDLAFVIAGDSDMSVAIVDASMAPDSLQFDHVAIFAGNRRNPYVIEASPEGGVKITPWHTFLRNAPKVAGKPGVVVKRLAADCNISTVISLAEARIGEPYDWAYLPDNGMTYCSELVSDTFFSSDGNRIFEPQPMNFLAPDGTMPQFWSDLFARLGTAVPQGVPGTNPNNLSRHPSLFTTHIYFR